MRSIKTGQVPLDELRSSLMRKFEEDDRRRGAPYLAPTPKISEEYKIEYKEHVEFLGDEEPFDSSILDLLEDDEESGVDYSEDVVGDEKSAPTDLFADNLARLSSVDQDESAVVIEESEPEEDYSEDDFEEDFEDDEEDLEAFDVVEESEPEEDDEEDFGDDEEDLEAFDVVEESEPEEDYEEDDEDDVDSISFDSEPVGKSLFGSTEEVEEPAEEPVEEPAEVPAPAPNPGAGSPATTAKPKKKVKRVVRRVVRKKKDEGVSSDVTDHFNSEIRESTKPVTRPVAKVRPKPKITSPEVQKTLSNPRTVVEYVKANPNCTIKEVSEHYSKKEIERSVRTGKIYVKGGRLSV